MDKDDQKVTLWLGLVYLLVKKELKVRYKGSMVGYLWSMLNPLMYMSILAFVFSHVMRFKTENYTLFILTGILGWNLFFQGVVLGTQSIVNNASLLKKVRVSGTIFTAAAVGSCLVNFLLALIPFGIISFSMTGKIPLTSFLAPFLLIPYVLFVFGIGLSLASLNVLFRDVSHMLEPILNMIFYATPIIYPLDVIPAQYRWILDLNPIAYYIRAIRQLMYEGTVPDLQHVGILIGLASISLAQGLFVYVRSKDKFIYRL